MALLINKNLTILGDIDITQMYVRITVIHGPSGDNIILNTRCYSSKAAYTLNLYGNSFEVVGIPTKHVFPYDRLTDSTDMLLYGHNMLKEYLTTDTYGDIVVIDPGTGEEVLDPETGLPDTVSAIIKEKFTDESSITIIDI